MSKYKIPSRLINSLCPVGTPSGQHRFDHDDCPEGTDTRHRLYIYIPHSQPWVRVAFCHNCSGEGFAKLREDSTLSRLGMYAGRHSKSINTRTLKQMGSHKEWWTFGSADQPVSVWRLDLKCHHLPEAAIVGAGIFYDAELGRYAIPQSGNFDDVKCPDPHTSSHMAEVYQLKIPGKFHTGAKTYTYEMEKGKKAKAHPIYRQGWPNNASTFRKYKTIIFVEDAISALWLHWCVKGAAVYNMMGLNLPTETFYKLAEGKEQIVLWTDNDVENCFRLEQEIEAQCEMFEFPKPIIIKYSKKQDPKLFNQGGVAEILQRHGVENV